MQFPTAEIPNSLTWPHLRDTHAATVVFILSSDRSGSTWLGYVLGNTPNASFLGEFYRAWDEGLRQPCAWCSANGREECEVLGGLGRYPVDRAFEIALARTQTRVLIDSSKRTAWAERFLAPDSRFTPHLIHLIRDPRGWYASEHRRRPENLTHLIGEWVRENLRIRSFLQTSNVPSTTMFYEDLAGSPLTAFPQLCDRIGCAFEPAALDYWTRPHHAFAANGASNSLLRSAPIVPDWFVTGDDAFYEDNARKSFVDRRWTRQLSESDALAIREDAQAAAFLNLYDRVSTPETLHHLTLGERALHRQLDRTFIHAAGNASQLENIYFVRDGIRHRVTGMPFIERLSGDWPRDLLKVPAATLERIPIGLPVRS